MIESKLSRFWTLIIVLLVAIISIGGIVAWSRYSPGQPIEIFIPQVQEWQGRIYIGGNVTSPGFYSFSGGDTIETLLRAAGGTTSANLSGIQLYIARVGEEQEAQKVDINRAEAWLLKALPGIGETLARRVVDYRQQKGPFRNTNELLKVAGIGTATYEQIKDLITVADR